MTAATQSPTDPIGGTARVLVVDADSAMTGLLAAWLAPQGCVVVDESAEANPAEPYDLAIIDVPFPRQRGIELVRSVADRYPATPILALSSSICTSVACDGEVARALGVACVLPKPASRDALVAAVRNLLAR